MTEIYKHYRTQGLYKVLTPEILERNNSHPFLMENPENKEWEEAVIYESFREYDPSSGQYLPVSEPRIFIRSKKRFEESFERWL